jgi:hypothetical protein
MKQLLKQIFPFILLATVYILLSATRQGYVDDLLHLEAINANNFYSLIISTTASMIGITIAVVLLAFQLIKKISWRNIKENALYDRRFLAFLNLAVFLIVFSTIAHIQSPDFHSVRALSHGYFLLILFLLFIIATFPLLFVILKSRDNIEGVLTVIEGLAIKDFDELGRATYSNDNQLVTEHRKPLFKVQHEIVYALRNTDDIDLSLIMQRLTERALTLIGEGKNQEDAESILIGLTGVWQYAQPEALRVGFHLYYTQVWNSIDKLYQHASNRRIALLHFQPLPIYIYNYINFLSNNRLSDALRLGNETIVKSFTLNLIQNCPPEGELSDLFRLFGLPQPDYQDDKEMQWDQIEDLLHRFFQILDASIKMLDTELYKTVIKEGQFLFKFVMRNLSEEQYKEGYLEMNIVRQILWMAERALDAGLFSNTMDIYPFSGADVAKIIMKKRVYVKYILGTLSDFLIRSQRKGCLDEIETLNKFGSIPRHTAKAYNENPVAQKATRFVFETLKAIKKEIEISTLSSQYRVYREVKSQMKEMVRSLHSHNVTDNLVQDIENEIATFQHTAGPKEGHIVTWPGD